MGLHIYRSPVNNRPLPSVTHILDKTQPLGEVIRFAKIREKKIAEGNGDKEVWDKLGRDGRNRGTIVHSYVENYLPLMAKKALAIKNGVSIDDYIDLQADQMKAYWEGKDSDNELSVGKYIKQFNKFIDELTVTTKGDWSILGLEGIVTHEGVDDTKYGFGGRYDFRLKIGSNNTLFDIKTTKGYYSKWNDSWVYEWALWRKAENLPVKEEKLYKNGNSRMVNAKLSNGKPKTVKEVRPQQPDWSWVSSYVRDKYLQQALYILASRDMTERGVNETRIDTGNVLVLFPEAFQLIRLPASVWSGCKLEAMARLEEFYTKYYDRWLMEVSYEQSGSRKEKEEKNSSPFSSSSNPISSNQKESTISKSSTDLMKVEKSYVDLSWLAEDLRNLPF